MASTNAQVRDFWSAWGNRNWNRALEINDAFMRRYASNMSVVRPGQRDILAFSGKYNLRLLAGLNGDTPLNSAEFPLHHILRIDIALMDDVEDLAQAVRALAHLQTMREGEVDFTGRSDELPGLISYAQSRLAELLRREERRQSDQDELRLLRTESERHKQQIGTLIAEGDALRGELEQASAEKAALLLKFELMTLASIAMISELATQERQLNEAGTENDHLMRAQQTLRSAVARLEARVATLESMGSAQQKALQASFMAYLRETDDALVPGLQKGLLASIGGDVDAEAYNKDFQYFLFKAIHNLMPAGAERSEWWRGPVVGRLLALQQDGLMRAFLHSQQITHGGHINSIWRSFLSEVLRPWAQSEGAVDAQTRARFQVLVDMEMSTDNPITPAGLALAWESDLEGSTLTWHSPELRRILELGDSGAKIFGHFMRADDVRESFAAHLVEMAQANTLQETDKRIIAAINSEDMEEFGEDLFAAMKVANLFNVDDETLIRESDTDAYNPSPGAALARLAALNTFVAQVLLAEVNRVEAVADACMETLTAGKVKERTSVPGARGLVIPLRALGAKSIRLFATETDAALSDEYDEWRAVKAVLASVRAVIQAQQGDALEPFVSQHIQAPRSTSVSSDASLVANTPSERSVSVSSSETETDDDYGDGASGLADSDWAGLEDDFWVIQARHDSESSVSSSGRADDRDWFRHAGIYSDSDDSGDDDLFAKGRTGTVPQISRKSCNIFSEDSDEEEALFSAALTRPALLARAVAANAADASGDSDDVLSHSERRKMKME